MVLAKLWKVYRGKIENWIIGLLEPVIDNIKKLDYVQRVEIKRSSSGDEPLSVRNVEHRTSQRFALLSEILKLMENTGLNCHLYQWNLLLELFHGLWFHFQRSSLSYHQFACLT